MAYLYLDDKKKKSHPGTLLFSSRGEIGRCKNTTIFYIVMFFYSFFSQLVKNFLRSVTKQMLSIQLV